MKRAVIIGASSGIGREVARIFIERGWRVGVAARREDKLRELKALSDETVEIKCIDVTHEDAPQLMLELINDLGGINLLVYCSGIGKQNGRLEMETELRTVDVNVAGFTRMLDVVFNYMADNMGGDIAVISSIAGTKGLGVAPSYSATKAYQNTYIQALEQLSNMRHLHIRFTDIRPGFVDTDLLAGNYRYPMLMPKRKVAREIVDSVTSHRHVRVIDWRYRILVSFWRIIPNWLWRRLNVGKVS
ncbi:MAG: SDR family NAD(P)-dependent oxidoreductase [Prevotella sp.]